MNHAELQEILKKHKKWFADEKDGKRADLQGADLRKADLQGADLRKADLQGAYLQGADLQRADLQEAYLRGADLQGAYLQGAEIFYRPDLDLIQNVNGTIRAWKYLKDGRSPYQNKEYVTDKEYETRDYDTNPFVNCGKGLNVATLSWCYNDSINKNGITFIEVEFDAKDIVCIPYTTDGKFRVKKLKVLKKYTKKHVENLLKIKEEP